MRLTEATRADDGVAMGVSPRGSIALIRGARSLAAIRGRSLMSSRMTSRNCWFRYTRTG